MEACSYHYRVHAKLSALGTLRDGGLPMADRLLIGFFLSNLDVTIVSSSLTSMTDSLEGFEKRSWIITGYLATYTGKFITWPLSLYFPLRLTHTHSGSMAIWTKVSDIIGRKQTAITALVILLGFSIGCGCAQTVNQL